jgi:hypothetical protein
MFSLSGLPLHNLVGVLIFGVEFYMRLSYSAALLLFQDSRRATPSATRSNVTNEDGAAEGAKMSEQQDGLVSEPTLDRTMDVLCARADRFQDLMRCIVFPSVFYCYC